ncbi:uncharacterized protein LOC131072039 isoform X2 [Cryptomeria japonica]|uniref:uncharacterized protein LOC131072039 isoform X2 n=1 Tax=Cryptomeria japonica TaxID=3369 RepID=UPI0027DA5B47|nr:uncharacterized protein LOC131072039 isoform X2 [Cryptomeria japonica]
MQVTLLTSKPGSIPRSFSPSISKHSVYGRGSGTIKCTFKNFDPTILEKIKDCSLGEHPKEDLLWEIGNAPLNLLTSAAAAVRDRRADSNVVTFSPKVFIPLTRACRDFCGYCTFSLPPKSGQKIYMTAEEVVGIARKGADVGCSEALFTLGDKPELLYPAAMRELQMLGHTTTISYVVEMAKLVLEETGLLPHINAGVISHAEIERLRQFSVSQGLMLESVSQKLLEFGGPHYNCPDKVPKNRIQMIALAGEQKVPFTSGLLIGIGETREERLQSLFVLRSLHQKYGHIQELIVQNFLAKEGTRMENATEPLLEELEWTIAMARLAFGPLMSIQAPPNLTPLMDGLAYGSHWKRLIEAGTNDWGGISPITKDWVNPEDGRIMKWVQSATNSLGYARADFWSPGQSVEGSFNFGSSCLSEKIYGQVLEKDMDANKVADIPTALQMSRTDESTISVDFDGAIMVPGSKCKRGKKNTTVGMILDKVTSVEELMEDEIKTLFSSVGGDVKDICAKADELRNKINGQKVTYVVNRNINYTNICSYGCAFCAFSKGQSSDNLRGKPYQLSLEEIARRTIEAWERGATEICMQVLDDEIRRLLCPDKITSEQWLEVIETAHRIGLRTTATIMFGHVDQPAHWAKHFIQIRDLQKRTNGFTEFVPLPFVHMEAPLYLRGKARKGPTKRECILMHAVARLALHPFITNIQASWVKMGPVGAQFLLSVGCNDMGGSLMNESITRAAGASHGEELHPMEMERIISSIGRIPRQRTTLYGNVSHAQVAKSLSAHPMANRR